MIRRSRAAALLAAAAATSLATGAHAAASGAPLLVFVVVADDIGWGNVGWHRNNSVENTTPNLASLASEGVVLDRHYVSPMCTPSRCSFLSGRLPVHVQQNLTNPEQPNGGIPFNMTTIPAKFKQAGYNTAFVGKWDAGWATAQHTPHGRGFDYSLAYASHKNDYYTQRTDQSACQAYGDPVDLWENTGPASTLNGTAYEEYIFHDALMSVLNAWDGKTPLFLEYAPHVAHCPLQVPQDVLARFAWLPSDESQCSVQTPYIFPNSTAADFRCRSQYEAMVSLLDEIVGNVTGVIRSKGAWNQTLMLFTSDNGGPEDTQENAATNHPLRGMKYSVFEGGVRAAAFMSGGYLPEPVRGTVQHGMIHVADWYTTFSNLIGVDPADPVAARAGLPPVDGLDVWPLISGANSTSPRTTYPINARAIIMNQYKLITGNAAFADWSGAMFPNATSPSNPISHVLSCGTGCLFDVVNDPTEHVDIAASNPSIVAQLSAALTAAEATFFNNNDTFPGSVCPGNVTIPCACWAANNLYGGFMGPYAVA